MSGKSKRGQVRTPKDPNASTGIPWSTLSHLFAALVILTYAFIRIGYRDIPLERDEGTYIYLGEQTLHGARPYVDFLELKPPGLYYSYALLDLVSMGDPATMHIWMTLFWAIGAWLLFLMARSWLGTGPSLVSLVAYAALSTSAHASGFTLQPDHLVAFFIIACMWALQRGLRNASSPLIVVAGALLGWSMMIKQNGLFFGFSAVFLIVMEHRSTAPKGWVRSTIRDTLLLAMGSSVIVAGVISTMAIQGVLGEFWHWTVEASSLYADQLSWAKAPAILRRSFMSMFNELPVPWVICGLGIPLLWLARIPGRTRWSLVAFLVAAAISVAPGKRFFGHYFLHFFPAFALFAGVAAHVVVDRTQRVLKAPLTLWPALILAIGLFVSIIATQHVYYFTADKTAVLRQVYGTNPFPDARIMADLINERYKKGDGLFVAGSEPQLYVYTGTQAPTRFICLTFMMQDHPMQDQWRSELLHDLDIAKPKYVVWVQHFGSWMPPPNSDQSFVEGLWTRIHRDYRTIAWCEQTGLYQMTIVTDKAAKDYTPQGQLYMFLAERKTGPDGGDDMPE